MRDTNQNDIMWLKHIIDAISSVQKALDDVSYEELCTNDVLSKSVAFNLLIIGEAANKLSKLFTFQYPNLPYREMIGTRNVIAHEYYQINYEIIWKVYKNHLPQLKTQIEQIIQELETMKN